MPSGVHLSMTTTVWPRCIEAPPKRVTAVWYIGEPMMWTFSSRGWMPKRKRSPDSESAPCSGVMPSNLRNTPLGLPVVPEV